MAKQPESKKSVREEKRRLKALERFEALEAFDQEYTDRGFCAVAGVDEVGRGALAGPVVSAAVVLPVDSGLIGVDDSKKLEPGAREELFDRIVACARNPATCSRSFPTTITMSGRRISSSLRT